MLIISGWGENSHRFGFQKGHLWSIVTNTLIVSERSSPVCPHLPHWLLLQRRACTALFWMFPDYLNASAWNILENQTLLWGRGSITLQAGKSQQMSWHFSCCLDPLASTRGSCVVHSCQILALLGRWLLLTVLRAFPCLAQGGFTSEAQVLLFQASPPAPFVPAPETAWPPSLGAVWELQRC